MRKYRERIALLIAPWLKPKAQVWVNPNTFTSTASTPTVTYTAGPYWGNWGGAR